jgi:Flp pilus assembly protein TadG
MRNVVHRHRQKGAVIITVALLMFFLLGFMAFALDFGKLFVVKSELQTAMDSCALAAAQELDSLPTSIDRARSAGLTAGNLNAVNFQSPTWSGQGQLVAADITFRSADYTATTNPSIAQYAQCQHVQAGVQMWLLKAMSIVTGDTTLFPGTHNVMASAVATRASSQTACPIPLALKPKVGGTAANSYGFVAGEWVTLLMGAGEATNGEIGWANLDGTNSASETVAEMNGKCGSEVGDTLGTPGVQAAVADVWNYRFGIYRNGVSPGTPATHNPDYSGYAYTALNWPSRFDAYYGSLGSGGADPTADSFDNKRAAFASCDDDGTRMRGGGGHSCESITGLDLNSFQDLAVPGTAAVGGHKTHGRDRRTVVVPVVNGSNSIIDWSCMLMLQPLSIPMVAVQLEFIGLAGQPGIPCVTNGMPGGWSGPLVPQLVR